MLQLSEIRGEGDIFEVSWNNDGSLLSACYASGTISVFDTNSLLPAPLPPVSLSLPKADAPSAVVVPTAKRPLSEMLEVTDGAATSPKEGEAVVDPSILIKTESTLSSEVGSNS